MNNRVSRSERTAKNSVRILVASPSMVRTKRIQNGREQERELLNSDNIIVDRGLRTMRLENRVALITGAARGVGKGIALRFASEGANVIVNYRSSREAAEKLCEQIRAMGRDATAIRADISSEDQVGKMLENTTSNMARLTS